MTSFFATGGDYLQRSIDKLNQEDLDSMRRFIVEYTGIEPQVPMQQILSTWDKNKSTLFKAFDRKLRIEYPINLAPSYQYVEFELQQIYTPAPLRLNSGNMFVRALVNNYCIHPDDLDTFFKLINYRNVFLRELDDYYVFKYAAKGELIIAPGTKFMKAVRKFLIYIDFQEWDLFEEWRNKISDIITKNFLKATLVLSIHPADFLSMSNNVENWATCMSWSNDINCPSGPIELMNNKYAVIAYLTTGRTLCGNIPSKTWRNILYVNKDILLSSKSYPYDNEKITKIALDNMRQLVYDNLKWKYQFGPERYYDELRGKNQPKKNNGRITFKLYSMYNDIKQGRKADEFYCYRNKVAREKVYCSSPPVCIKCGNKIVDKNNKTIICQECQRSEK